MNESLIRTVVGIGMGAILGGMTGNGREAIHAPARTGTPMRLSGFVRYSLPVGERGDYQVFDDLFDAAAVASTFFSDR
jgi:hypothetical protein